MTKYHPRTVTMLQARSTTQQAHETRQPRRQRKRRCDRKLPICDLCSRKGVECSYPGRNDGSPAAASSGPSAPRVTTPESGSSESYTRMVQAFALPVAAADPADRKARQSGTRPPFISSHHISSTKPG